MTIDLLSVVLAAKVMHMGAIHGLIQSGGVVPLDVGQEKSMFGIRFIPNKSINMCKFELVTSGIQQKTQFQRDVRAKVIKVKEVKVKKIKEIDTDIKQEELI